LIKKVANWTATEGLQFVYDSLYANLSMLRHYVVTIVVQPPFIEKYKNDKNEDAYRGYCIDMIEKIKEIVDFRYSMYEVPDQTYGSINEQGEWNGLIRELIDGVNTI
jgi:ionotropic glutamate receptor